MRIDMAGISQECAEPGLWYIDGYIVRRHQSGRWSITDGKECLGGGRTLSDCRALIVGWRDDRERELAARVRKAKRETEV